MHEIKKGDRVRCVRRDAAEGIVFEVGSLAIVKETYPATPYLLELTGGILVHTSRWEVANTRTAYEHEPEIIVNGAVYILKPKPHEWKFGDWARYNETGDVVFVISWEPLTDTVVVVRDEKTSGNAPVFMETKNLTYISSAEIPT